MNKKPTPSKAPKSTGSKAPVKDVKIKRDKTKKKISYNPMIIKCTNGKTFRTYSTIGRPDITVEIPAYDDVFTNGAYNKDKKAGIKKDSAFAKKFGNDFTL